jgi:dTDP-4-amino-4,6-dideoxygalactose transaminase
MSRSTGTPLPNDPTGRRWLTVSSPLLPDLLDFTSAVADIFDRRWLTNQGHYARTLESALRERLGVADLSLLTNGTVAIELMVRSLLDGGEVIVPAYSFPATWCFLADNPRYKPVFVDVRDDFQIDPDAVAAAVTPRTTGILGVHVYGAPADHEALASIARRHGLALMYDAAHAFGVRVNGTGIGNLGDLASFSFHATKVFNTLEGGCVTSGAENGAAEITKRRSFGISSDEAQDRFGTNGKMDEVRAAFGLAALPLVDGAIAARARIAARYKKAFRERWVDEIRLPAEPAAGVEHNWAYYPVRFHASPDRNRDLVNAVLRERGILARKYFSSTALESPLYDGLLNLADLPRTRRIMDEVLCLPIHHAMTDGDADAVVDAIAEAWLSGEP